LDISQRNLFLLGLFTLLGMGGIGLAILYFAEGVTPATFFTAGSGYMHQVGFGTLFGISSAVAALWIVNLKWFANEMQFFTDLINKQAPTYAHAVFYSFCAGVGEEILFRGGIQPYLGIWLTSFVFILLHGYINPFNIALSIYGLFMVLISSGLGYLFEMYGIIASITAHFLFDLVMFVFMRRTFDSKNKG
jgi:membrane protease YdiL (CAAX protease family)